MKKYLNFILGFITCFILIISIKYLPNIVYADSNNKEIFEFKKANYPIFSNGIKTNVDAYNYNGNTYLKIIDLNNSLYGINITWDQENFRVNMDNIFEPTVLNYENNQYYELPIIFNRYMYKAKLPYSCGVERNKSNNECWFYMNNEMSLKDGENGEKLGEVDEVYINGVFIDNKAYISKSEFFNNISKLLEMIIENENYIELNPESIQ
ncbi:MAG TPA: hypothetical protein DC000_00300 [Clostridiales bacterium]|nr:hypothetical protein [Clostridiales bacterium]